jgi:rhamnogalacturonyl hydrolase YesR/lysophospholipase L1-like esterase
MTSLLLLFLLGTVSLQTTADTDSAVVRRIADRILENYETGYLSYDARQPYDDPRDVPADDGITLKSSYVNWHYTTGIINSALLEYSALSGDSKYADHTVRHTDYCLQEYTKVRLGNSPSGDWHPFYGLRRFDELDFVGTQGGALIDIEGWYGVTDYEVTIQKAAEHIRHGQARLPDGTLVRTWPEKHTLWADDLNMGLDFMTRYAVHYGDSLMLRDAIRQVDNFNKYLWDSKAGLYWHAWYEETGSVAGWFWGRCNGWIMKATVELLDCLDPESADFKRICGYLQRQIDGLRPLQRRSGMWRNVLNRKSYEESSCTAIFAGAIAHAVRNGWIDRKYADMALKAWDALKRDYIKDGQLNGVCVGTGIMDGPKGYAGRPTKDGDSHGAGLILNAGMEIMALKDYLAGAYAVSLRPTFNSCSVELDSPQPVPGLKLEYRKRGDIRWTVVDPLPYYKNQPGYRGSIFRLDEDTAYECRAVTGNTQRSLTRFRTWKSRVPVARTVVLDPGTVTFPVLIGDKGNPTGWIRYTVPQGTVLENRGDTPTFIIDGAAYVLLDDITMKGPNIHDGAVNVKNSKAVRIRNCEISDWGRIGEMRFDLKGKPAVDGRVINFDGAVKIMEGSSEVVVERCYIHDPAGRSNSWRYSHPAGNEAVILYKPDHSTVLRYNDFVGGGDFHRFNDAVESLGNFDEDGGFNRDADVYGNFLAFCNDDCIELDGGQRNVRCFGNRIEGALVGVSVQGCMQGPSFVYDNLFSGLGDEFDRRSLALKVGSGKHGPEARSWFFDNLTGPQGGGVGHMETLELHESGNVSLADERDFPEQYPVRPCPFVLSRQRFTNPEYEFSVTLKALPELSGSVPFTIRQNDECDWFEVSPSSGVLNAGGELILHVRLLKDRMQSRRFWHGAFLVRTSDGLSRPCTIYKETDFIPPFNAEKPGDTAIYLDAASPDATDGEAQEWSFTVPKTRRYYILLHGSGKPFTEVLASINGSEMQLSRHQTCSSFASWTILAPGGDFNNRIAYYDFEAGKVHTLRLSPGPDPDKRLKPDGIVITDNPEAFEPGYAGKPSLHLAGDSMSCYYPEKVAPQTGWGQCIASALGDANIPVFNHAVGGESTKSFIDSGKWQKLIEGVRPGDIVFIMFGHNDEKASEARHTDPSTTYKENLTRFIDETRAKGARPVLLTSVSRRFFNDDGTPRRTHGDYPQAMRELAAATDTPLIDTEELSYQWLLELGPEGSVPYFVLDKRDPSAMDNTHLTREGAEVIAGMIAGKLNELKIWKIRKHRK